MPTPPEGKRMTHWRTEANPRLAELAWVKGNAMGSIWQLH